MAETIVSNFKLKGREILSSYAAFTLEGVMSAKVKRGKENFTLTERNGIAKGTSDGEAEAIYIPNDKAIKSISKNIEPLLPKKVVINKPRDILDACEAFDLKLVEKAGPNKKNWGIYVCDRVNNRLQVFKPDGTFVQEIFVKPNSLGDGSVWDISFSPDPEQTFIYMADGTNRKIYIIERKSMEILTNFGAGGRNPGQFFAVHGLVTDSKGNIYTTETYEGKRVPKFKYMGMGPVTVMDQGTPWPAEKK